MLERVDKVTRGQGRTVLRIAEDGRMYEYLRHHVLFLTNDVLPAGQLLNFLSSCRYAGRKTTFAHQNAGHKLLYQDPFCKEHDGKEPKVRKALCMKTHREERRVLGKACRMQRRCEWFPIVNRARSCGPRDKHTSLLSEAVSHNR